MADVTRVNRPAPTVELYAKAAAGSLLPDALWGGGDQLPQQVLERLITPDRTNLAEYNAVCGFADAERLPPTYPHVLGFPLSMQIMTSRSFPMPTLGMVHVNNTIDVLDRVPVDAELAVRVWPEGPRPHARGAEVDFITEVLDGERPLWRETSTYLSRGSKIGRGEPAPKVEWAEPPADGHVRPVSIGSDIGRRYGSVSGDRNPIHLHALSARPFGFKRAIAHGMWTLANSLAVATVPFEPPYRVAASFRKPVFLPAEARLITATVDGQLRIWLTGPTSETLHVAMTVDQLASGG